MRLSTFFAALAIAGCGGNTPQSMDPAPPAHGFQIKTTPVMLQPGDEKYMCFTQTLNEPADVAVIKFDSVTTPQVHHFEVFQAVSPEQDGLFDCSQQLIKLTWLPLFGGGVNAGGLTVPDGAGFKLPKNAQLLVQLHLLNATPNATSTHVVVNGDYAADATTITPAGIFALGSMTINLPPGATNMKIDAGCALPKDLNVFAVQPHMHLLGTKINLSTGTSQATASQVYARDPWVFGAQPIDNFVMPLKQGQYVSTECEYDNTTDQTVTYGESTKNEMCFFVLFYTPFDHLDGCIQ